MCGISIPFHIKGHILQHFRHVWRKPVSLPKLAETCILAGCPVGGIVLDPFMGSGTTGAVAKGLNRQYIGIELNEEYCRLAEERIKKVSGDKKIGEGCV